MKNFLRFLLAGTVVLVTFAMAIADEFSADSITRLMKMAAGYSFKNFGGGTAAGLDNDWSRGTIMTGIMGLYRVTGEKQWLDSVDKWGAAHNWTWMNNGSADNHCCMQTYCERYMVNPVQANAYMYTPSLANVNDMMKGPGHGLWGWQDAMYMSPPVWSMIGSITGQQIYFDSLTSFWWNNVSHLYDTTYHLWYWADEAAWYKTPKGNPKFWGPGNAWVIGGMVRCMKYMPQNYSQRPKWVALFKEFCDAVRSKQQPDGMWRTSLYEPTEFPDPEASCTSFFIYAFSLGVSWGILDSAAYLPVICKAWTPLAKCVLPSGMVGRCQPWNNSPGGAGLNNNTPEGQGAFMLAGEGMLLHPGYKCSGTEAKGKNALPRTGSFRAVQGFVFSNLNRVIHIPEGAKNIEIYSLNGKKIWGDLQNNDKSFIVPQGILQNGVYIIKFAK
jgi:unsaturated rhamnogalacturonyl hydrolase